MDTQQTIAGLEYRIMHLVQETEAAMSNVAEGERRWAKNTAHAILTMCRCKYLRPLATSIARVQGLLHAVGVEPEELVTSDKMVRFRSDLKAVATRVKEAGLEKIYTHSNDMAFIVKVITELEDDTLPAHTRRASIVHANCILRMRDNASRCVSMTKQLDTPKGVVHRDKTVAELKPDVPTLITALTELLNRL